MRLYMKQKVFSFGDKFDIWDESGNPKYKVEGEIFSFGKKLHVIDLYDQQEVLYVTQKLWSFMPQYELHIGGRVAAVVQKRLAFFQHRFDIQGTDLYVDGEPFAHEFLLLNGQGEAVMALSKRYMSWGDSYQMEILDPAMELLCIGINLCIDAALHDHKG